MGVYYNYYSVAFLFFTEDFFSYDSLLLCSADLIFLATTFSASFLADGFSSDSYDISSSSTAELSFLVALVVVADFSFYWCLVGDGFLSNTGAGVSFVGDDLTVELLDCNLFY